MYLVQVVTLTADEVIGVASYFLKLNVLLF